MNIPIHDSHNHLTSQSLTTDVEQCLQENRVQKVCGADLQDPLKVDPLVFQSDHS